MERKLIHYLPYVVREIAEFKGIATGEQPEFELAWDRAAELLDNQFVYNCWKLRSVPLGKDAGDRTQSN